MACLRPSLFLVQLLGLLAFGAYATTEDGTEAIYTDEYLKYPDDPDASKAGKDHVANLCSGGFAGGDDWEPSKADRKKYLKDEWVGETNILYEALEQAGDSFDIATLQEYMLGRIEFLLGKAWPFLVIVLSGAVWCCCCYCCCNKTTCCMKERSCAKPGKFVGLLAFCGIIIIVLIQASMTMGYVEIGIDGFSNTACSSAKLLNQSLNGRDTPRFIGFIPMLREFHELRLNVLPGSPFLTELGDQIDLTKSIDDAVVMATGTLNLLSTALADAEQKITKDGRANNGLAPLIVNHYCVSCATLATTLTEVATTLDGSVATALVDTRATLKTELQGPGIASFADIMDAASSGIVEVKDMIVSSIPSLVDLFIVGKDLLTELGMFAALLFTVLILGLGCCTLCGCGCWIMNPDGNGEGCCFMMADPNAPPATNSVVPDGPSDEPKKEASAGKPSQWTTRCACCTCYFGFPLLWLICFVSGLLGIIVLVLSSLCLIMDDLDRGTLEDIGEPMNMNMSDNGSMGMLLTMVDKCFNPKDGNYSHNLLDILEAENGTMREKIVGEVRDNILSQFDKIDTQMADQNGKLAEDPSLLKLTAQLRDEPFATWVIPVDTTSDPSTILNTLAGTGDAGLVLAGATSMFCGDHTPSGVEGFGGATIPGLNSFDTALAAFVPGAPVDCLEAPFGACATYGCIRPLTCPGGNSVCDAGNDLLSAKKTLVQDNIFKCNVFVKANGADCDPLNPGDKDCCQRNTDGSCKLVPKDVACNFQTFAQHVKDFSTRITNVFENIDNVQVAVGPQISNGMRKTVQKYVFDPLDEVVDGMLCGFLGLIYREMVEGLCYQGVYGLGNITQMYHWVLIWLMVLIFLAFLLWRFNSDNIAKQKTKGSSPKVVDASAPEIQ
jgi:hypothetical protein